MKLIIIRHGETEENSQKILQGLLPGKLNRLGIKQAKELGQKLAREKIDYIYCSPINRCVETLNNIKLSISSDIPIYFSNLIQERDFGLLSGKKIKNVDIKNIDLGILKDRS